MLLTPDERHLSDEEILSAIEQQCIPEHAQGCPLCSRTIAAASERLSAFDRLPETATPHQTEACPTDLGFAAFASGEGDPVEMLAHVSR